MPTVAVVACGLFFGLSAVTFAGAVVLVRRARRVEGIARATLGRALEERSRAEEAHTDAKRIHANCRPAPFSVPGAVVTVWGPLGRVRTGVA